ncbi:hypothetical protein PCE1_003291 [Barthelona sp. PCE]
MLIHQRLAFRQSGNIETLQRIKEFVNKLSGVLEIKKSYGFWCPEDWFVNYGNNPLRESQRRIGEGLIVLQLLRYVLQDAEATSVQPSVEALGVCKPRMKKYADAKFNQGKP